MTAKYLPITPHDWMTDARCAEVDPDLWFPEIGSPAPEAKKICGSCPVAAQCAELAVTNNERHGIWAGLSARDRQQLRMRAA